MSETRDKLEMSMPPEAVRDALTEILRDELHVDTDRIERDSRLVDDVGLDSVAFAVGMCTGTRMVRA